MIRKLFLLFALSLPVILPGQDRMTPELMWGLKRVSPVGITPDREHVVYSVTQYQAEENTKTTKNFIVPIAGGPAREVSDYSGLIHEKELSPDGKHKIVSKDVKVKNVFGTDLYPDLRKSNVHVYDDLMYRHWDEWEDGAFSHLFIHSVTEGELGEGVDIMMSEPYNCPQKPFGGSEDYVWSPDSKQVLYATKKKYGTEYTLSTNTDIYAYDLESGSATNLTWENKGYDTQPAFSSDGKLAWLSMKRDGYEADKNDIIVDLDGTRVNLTKNWDETVTSFLWGTEGRRIYFNAPISGTVQLFEIGIPESPGRVSTPRQVTEGQFDIGSLVGITGDLMVVSRSDINHAAELFTVNLRDGTMQAITHENDSVYTSIHLSRIDRKMVLTTDGKEMLTYVIFPPDFDPDKRYPTLLYCKGGPQGPLSQAYSYRWNYQLMAAQGYIVVAPSRRGMSGFGIEWNEQISGDWGGQNMQDYLSAIDALAKEPYVDQNRLGCVGASYGGYSVFYLAGIHEKRFKTFIAHDGTFNLVSMYGTTEELFFVNWEMGGPYWETGNPVVKKSYGDFNPVNMVAKWDTPILIIQGGRDYRVPIGQSLEAFQAAQVRGIRSRLLYFPEENHWVLSAQNGLVWQREFFRWLAETL